MAGEVNIARVDIGGGMGKSQGIKCGFEFSHVHFVISTHINSPEKGNIDHKPSILSKYNMRYINLITHMKWRL